GPAPAPVGRHAAAAVLPQPAGRARLRGGRRLPLRRGAVAGAADRHPAGDGRAHPRPARSGHRPAPVLPTGVSGVGARGRRAGEVRPRVVAREDVAELLSGGVRQREGVFTLLFALALAVAILAILVTSGFGLSERRREVGILKATGWQTDQLLLRSLVESLVL